MRLVALTLIWACIFFRHSALTWCGENAVLIIALGTLGLRLMFLFFFAAKNSCANFQLPTKDKLKTVVDKVKDFLGETKESFGKLTFLNNEAESSEEDAKEKSTRAWWTELERSNRWICSSSYCLVSLCSLSRLSLGWIAEALDW